MSTAHWKFNTHNKTMFVPKRVYVGVDVYCITEEYDFDGKVVKFRGHQGLIRKKGEDIELPIEQVTWLEFKGDGINTMRSGENELRNFLYKKWFGVYGDNTKVDGYVSWEDFYTEEREKIFGIDEE